MPKFLFLLLFILSCSQVEVKQTCLSKFNEIEEKSFTTLSGRELANHDNYLRLTDQSYGKKHFKGIEKIEQEDSTCFHESEQSFAFSKAVIDNIDQYPAKTREKIFKDLVHYVEFRVNSKDNSLQHNLYLYGLLNKATRKGYFLKSRNRIILKMRELAQKWDQIKGVEDPKEAKLEKEILYQVSRGHILEILERG